MELLSYIRDKKFQEIIETRIDEKGFEWARLSRGRKIGIFVSNSSTTFGWAVCNPLDGFDLKRGLSIARGREKKMGHKMPQHLYTDFMKFAGRCSKYYKDDFLGVYENKAEYLFETNEERNTRLYKE